MSKQPSKVPTERERNLALESRFGMKSAERFQKAVTLFNAAEFWESHELFEEIWRAHKGDVKTLAQGFLQAAAAGSEIQRNRYHSAVYLFERSMDKFSATAHMLPQIDIPRLLQKLKRAKKEVERLGENGLDRFDARFFPTIEMAKQGSRRASLGGTMLPRAQ